MRSFLIISSLLISIAAQARDIDMEKASAALIKAVGSSSVICNNPGDAATYVAPMAFYAIRNLQGRLAIALDGGAVTSTETGFFAYVKGDQLYFDVGDDDPSDIFRFSLKALKAGLKPHSRVKGWFYLSDRSPKEGGEIECYVNN